MEQQPQSSPADSQASPEDLLARTEFRAMAVALVLPLLLGVALLGLVYGGLQVVQGHLDGVVAFVLGLGVAALVVKLTSAARLLD